MRDSDVMRHRGAGPWAVVALVGAIVVGLVFGLGLFNRLSAGQDVLDDGKPAFTAERAAGARAGIEMISTITDFAEPVTTERGRGVAEVPKLIAFVSKQTGLSQAQVVATLRKEVPHTTALLQAVPLSAVSAELPGLTKFLAKTLKLSPAELNAALAKNFPGLTQTITALPKVTDGWHQVPGTSEMTRFSGDPVRSVPDVRDYFRNDLIPVVERQHGNFTDLAGTGGVGFIPALLLVLGLVVIAFGGGMALRARQGLTRGQAVAGWSVVTAVGALVMVLVMGLQLFPRLGGGDELLNDARPAFTAERVAGARAGIEMVSAITDFAEPVTTERGRGVAEVPKLVAFVSKQTGLSQAEVLGALQKGFPHTTALLQAVPLSAVTAELPKLQKLLGTVLKLSPAELNAALGENFPGLAQTITALPKITDGWHKVPGTAEHTRFSGDPVSSVPDVRAYFREDVIPVLERQQANFQDLDDPWPPVNVFPPLLLLVGMLVMAYGVAMLTRLRLQDASKVAGGRTASAG